MNIVINLFEQEIGTSIATALAEVSFLVLWLASLILMFVARVFLDRGSRLFAIIFTVLAAIAGVNVNVIAAGISAFTSVVIIADDGADNFYWVIYYIFMIIAIMSYFSL